MLHKVAHMNEDVRTCGQGVCPIDVSKSVFHKPIGAVYHLVEGQSLICYAGFIVAFLRPCTRSTRTCRSTHSCWPRNVDGENVAARYTLYYVVLTEEGWRHCPSQLELRPLMDPGNEPTSLETVDSKALHESHCWLKLL